MASLAATLAPWPAVVGQLASFVTILRRGTIHDSKTLTGLAAGLLKNLVASPESADLVISTVAAAVAAIAEHFSAVAPTEFAVGSVARRVCAIIREEAGKTAPARQTDAASAAALTDAPEGGILAARQKAIRALAADASLESAAAGTSPTSVDSTASGSLPFRTVQEGVVDGVAELQDEIDALGSSLEAQALDLFSPGDVVLTHGYSRTVVGLLVYAARKAAVETFVTEGGPSLSGHAAALQLATLPSSSKTAVRTLIPDAAAWSVMPRVSKVVLGARAVTPGGDVIADAGALAIAQAAAAHGVPVVVVCSALELVPPAVAAARPWEAAVGPAAEALPATLAERAGGAAVIVPLLDCIPAALVSLIVTNAQSVAPGQVARLFAETF